MIRSIIILLLAVNFSYAQKDSECHVPAAEEFAMLSLNKNFNMEHDLPNNYKHFSQDGKMIKFKVPEGEDANAFALKAKTETNNYLFVIHEWWGLNEHIKKEAERLYNALGNVNVLAIDLYDGNVASTREEAGNLMRSVSMERAVAIIKGAFDHAGDNAEVATIGWCFGGGWSLQSALIGGGRIIGCVIYYGMPEKDVEKLKTLNSDVLGIFASREQWISPQVVKEFEENMKNADKQLAVHSFDANHAFANPSSESYNSEAATEANKISLAYLKEKFE